MPQPQAQSGGRGRGAQNRWSKGAGVTGAFVACALTIPSDVSPAGFWSLLDPFAAIVAGIFERFHIQVATPVIMLFLILNIFANAIWFMILAESFRLLRLRIRGL